MQHTFSEDIWDGTVYILVPLKNTIIYHSSNWFFFKYIIII